LLLPCSNFHTVVSIAVNATLLNSWQNCGVQVTLPVVELPTP